MRLRDLERENSELKKLMANQLLKAQAQKIPPGKSRASPATRETHDSQLPVGEVSTLRVLLS